MNGYVWGTQVLEQLMERQNLTEQQTSEALQVGHNSQVPQASQRYASVDLAAMQSLSDSSFQSLISLQTATANGKQVGTAGMQLCPAALSQVLVSCPP